MSMQVTSSRPADTIASPVSEASTRASNRREAYKQMGSAMQSGDLSSARSAYATMVRNAPPGASMQAGSPFAQLGKALATGDMSGAQSAWNTMVQDRLGNGSNGGTVQPGPVSTAPVDPVASTSSTGGVSGTTLNVTA